MPSPMNKPMKMLGMAAGIGDSEDQVERGRRPACGRRRGTRRACWKCPEAVSIVTGNQTASAISPTAETIAEGGETTIASGIHAVAGIGPTTLSSGIPQ